MGKHIINIMPRLCPIEHVEKLYWILCGEIAEQMSMLFDKMELANPIYLFLYTILSNFQTLTFLVCVVVVFFLFACGTTLL